MTTLKLLRIILGKSLTEISKASGVSVAHLSLVENGKRNLSETNKIDVASALGVPAVVFSDIDPRLLIKPVRRLKEKIQACQRLMDGIAHDVGTT